MMDYNGVYVQSRTGIRRTNNHAGPTTKNPLVTCVPLSRPVEDIALDNASPKNRLDRPVKDTPAFVTFDPRKPLAASILHETKQERATRIWENISGIPSDETRKRQAEEADLYREIKEGAKRAKEARIQQKKEERRQQAEERSQQLKQQQLEGLDNAIRELGALMGQGVYIDTLIRRWLDLEVNIRMQIEYFAYSQDGRELYWVCRKLVLLQAPSYFHWQIEFINNHFPNYSEALAA